MKRVWLTVAIILSVFLMTVASVRQSIAQHEVQAKSYISQGLYDEALQEYNRSFTNLSMLKSTIHLFGEFNAFLATVGILFLASGLLIRRRKRLFFQ